MTGSRSCGGAGRGTRRGVGMPRDPVIPVDHTVNAHETLPGSRLELFDGAGHFPHIDDPRRFVHLLHEFVTTTEPAHADRHSLRRHLQETP